MKQRFIKLFLSFWFLIVFAAFGAEPTGAQADTRSSLQNQKSKELPPLLQIPSLDTEADKLRFLFAIQKQVPKLFSDSVRYDIDLFKLLEADKELLTKLLSNPEYIKEFSKRQSLSDIDVSPPNTTINIETINQSKVLESWKKSLSNLVDQELGTAAANSSPNEALEKLISTAKQRGSLPDSPDPALGALRALLSKDLSPEAMELKELFKTEEFKKASFEQKIQLIQKNSQKIASKPLTGFKPAAAGFVETSSPKTYGDLIDAMSNIVDLDKRPLSETIQLVTVLKKSKTNVTDKEKVKSEIDKLTWDDYQYVHDKKDVLIPQALEMGLEERAAETLGTITLKKQKQLLKENTQAENVPLKPLRISEVPPHVGIFRGCASGDCSSQYSFPYPNDPHERVFFIYPENSPAPKGIISSTIVNSDGKKSLYVITLQGSLNAADAITALHGLEKIKTQIGVEQIIIPPNPGSGLINNEVIAKAVRDAAKRGKEVPIQYQDPEIRSTIENVKTYNSGKYDHMSKNTSGKTFIPQKEVLDALKVEYAPQKPEAIELPSLNKFNTLLFALDMHKSKRPELVEKTLRIGGHDPEKFKQLTEVLKNEKKQPVESYVSEVTKLAEEMTKGDGSFDQAQLKAIDYLFYLGRMNAPDALEGAHYKESMRLLRQNVRKALKENEKPEVGWKLIQSHQEKIKQDKSWNEMIVEHFKEKSETRGLSGFVEEYSHLVSTVDQNSKSLFGPAFVRAIEVADEKGDLYALIPLAQHGDKVFLDHPEAMAAFKSALVRAIEVAGEKGDLVALRYFAEKGHEALKAHPEALMKLIEKADEKGDFYALTPLAQHVDKVFLAHPEALMKFIELAGEKGDLTALKLLAANGHEALKAHPEALMKFIEVAGEKGDLSALTPLAQHGDKVFLDHPEAMAAFKPALVRAIELAGEKGDLSALRGLAQYGHKALKAHPEALMKFIEVAGEKGDLSALTPLAQHGDKVFLDHPEALMKFIELAGEKGDLRALTPLAQYEHEALKAHPEALMKFIGLAGEKGDLRTLSNLAQYGHEALKAHPEAMAAFKSALDRAIGLAGEKGDLYALTPFPQHGDKVFLDHPEALMKFIEVAGEKGDLSELSNLAQYGHEALKAHPEAMAAFKPAFVRAIKVARQQVNIDALSVLAVRGHEALKAYPEAMAAFKPAFVRAIEVVGEKGDLSALSVLAVRGHEALKAYPEAMAAFKPAFVRAIEVVGEKGDLYSLRFFAQFGHEALKAHKEALLALLEVLVKIPKVSDPYYEEAIKNTKEFLEKEFNNGEKLSELFLSSKKGKEVLLALANNKIFQLINKWFSRTKRSLPAETFSLIKDTDAHQKEARKSLSSASSSTDSSSENCLRFLRLVSLKKK